jgi:tetratricopeptide (TPR) repeat protein
MFQKYLYNTLDEVERVHLHEQVGKIIEELYGEKTDEVSVQLARHFQEAGLPEKAFEYLVKAGTRAIHLSAYEETIVLFEKALDILKTFPESAERDQQELNLQMATASASQSLKGFGTPEIVTYCSRIEELCKKIGDAPQIFYAHYFLAHFHWLRADLEISYYFTEQMMRDAQKVKDEEKIALSYYMQGMIYFYLGNMAPALENLRMMNAYYIPEKCSHLKYIYSMDPGLVCGMNTACVLWALGYPDQALLQSQKMLPQVRLLNHSFSSVASLAFNSLLHIFRKDGTALEPLGKEIYSVSEKKGFVLFIGVGLFKTGFALAHQGQVKEGINKLLQALEIYKVTGIRFTLSDLLGSISEAYGMYGDIEKAMDFMEQALTEVQRGGEHYYEAELYRIKGELILKKADDKNRKEEEKKAEECFKQSLKVAQEQMAKSFELRTSLSLCRLLKKQDKKEEAIKLLTKIYNWFTEGFEEPDLKEAKAMMEDLKSGK